MSKYSFITSGAPRQPGESNWKYHVRKLFTVKTLTSVDEDAKKSTLSKSLSVFDLLMIGLGGIIGSGIFVLTGEAAGEMAGPAVVISFILAGITASFSALSYSELASMIPISGSTYSYAYATMGELVAWIIGWDLTLEYLVGASAVAVGWSGYFVNLFKDGFNIEFSDSWTSAPITYSSDLGGFEIVPGAYFNVPAFTIIIFLTILSILGIKESARFNTMIVSVKLIVLTVFCIAAGIYVDPKNYSPFIPPNEGSFSQFGFTGVLAGTSVVFFAFIGFDSISTTSQEARNPQKDLPIAIMSSFGIVTIYYISVWVTGMQWLGIFIDFGAICGLSSVILVLLMGQPRIFLAMANDGLFFPKLASRIHPRFKTPYITTAACGLLCAIVSALFPIGVLAELTSVGTLLAFFIVNIGVIILRFTASDVPRKFRVPGGPFLFPLSGALLDLLLLATSSKASIERLFIWMAVGLLIYIFYGRRHSKANNPNKTEVMEMEDIDDVKTSKIDNFK
ncbi:408_t:CDS:2 [Diversispora eburnea]|uniref:408_t:CDS:1 n=1 Tax=Diversispora eburnea TaxID=1213867 RepID=A0A9N8WCW7_9GLOM|nr:408_t:CDS:2 [Diversispora eburnea]